MVIAGLDFAMYGSPSKQAVASCTTTTTALTTGTTTTDNSPSKFVATPSRSGANYRSRDRLQSGWGVNIGETKGKQDRTEVKKALAASLSAPPPVVAAGTAAVENAGAAAETETEAPSQAVGKWLSEEKLRALQRGVEWYFSDEKLCTDQELHHKISQNLPEGFLCISELLCMEPLKQLGLTPELVVRCLKNSFLETKVTLTADELLKAAGKSGEFGNRGIFVRRKQPLPPLLNQDSLQDKKGADAPWLVISDPRQLVFIDRHSTMNRLRDLWKVQRTLKLSEVGDEVTVFKERISPNVRPEHRPANGEPVVFAVGYERIIYGDHGPYMEFSSSQIRWKAWPHYFDKSKYRSYYHEYYTKASHGMWEAKWRQWDYNASKGLLMLYVQTKDVSDRQFAPGAYSDPHAGRAAGYADYRPGYFYAAADDRLIIVEKPKEEA